MTNLATAPAKLRQVIGENTADRRKKLGMTQRQLAELVGYDRRWVSAVEAGRGRISLDCLPQFAKALRLTDPLCLLTPHVFRSNENIDISSYL